MTLMGWVFMVGSACSVWGLTLWCFKKVLSAPKEPPEQVKHFHNA